ncbi:MAG: hypothetical protein ACOH2N_07310 [Devosia sp.]
MTANSVATADQNLVPSFQFSTVTIAAKEQFDHWHQFMPPIAEVKLSQESGAGFRGHAKLHDFGVMQLCSFDINSATFTRSSSQIRKYGIELWASVSSGMLRNFLVSIGTRAEGLCSSEMPVSNAPF